MVKAETRVGLLLRREVEGKQVKQREKERSDGEKRMECEQK